jgi:hypothetical protein
VPRSARLPGELDQDHACAMRCERDMLSLLSSLAFPAPFFPVSIGPVSIRQGASRDLPRNCCPWGRTICIARACFLITVSFHFSGLRGLVRFLLPLYMY